MTRRDAALAISASTDGFGCALRTAAGGAPSTIHRRDDLATAIADLVTRAGRTSADLDEIRLDIGPGSYTGLRVAVTFARTLQQFAGVTVRTTTSMELLALHAWTDLGVSPALIVRPILNAHRRRWHHAAVALHGDGVDLETQPLAVERDALCAAISASDVLLAEASTFAELGPALAATGATLLTDAGLDPVRTALALFDPRLRLRTPAADALAPLYLMGSYADP